MPAAPATTRWRSLLLPLPHDRLPERVVRCLIGLSLFGFGISCFLTAELGVAPWDVLHQGLERKTGIPIGIIIEITGVFILLLWIPLRERMGLGSRDEVATSVIPKPVIVSAGDDCDSIVSRYFTPRRCHASHAVTGAVGVASAFALPGTVASGAASSGGTRSLVVLHPAGQINVEVELEGEGAHLRIHRAALLRTARLLMRGQAMVPAAVWR